MYITNDHHKRNGYTRSHSSKSYRQLVKPNDYDHTFAHTLDDDHHPHAKLLTLAVPLPGQEKCIYSFTQ